jgi:hypothetical protein
LATAIPAIKRKRQQDLDEKIKKVKVAINQWEAGRRNKDWKVWVAAKTDYTVKWITRALNKGYIQQPNQTK